LVWESVTLALHTVSPVVRHTVLNPQVIINVNLKTFRRIITLIAARPITDINNAESLRRFKLIVVDATDTVSILFE